jgi:hypothetical protein
MLGIVPSCPTGVNGAQDQPHRPGAADPAQPDPDDAPTPAEERRREAYWRAVGPPGNLHLVLLGQLLSVAEDVALAYLRSHTRKCGCDSCVRTVFTAAIREDVAGLAWVAGLGRSMIEGSYAGYFERPDGDTFGDDLWALAELSDRLDAAERAEGAGDDEEADADEPVTVGPA